MKKLFLLLLLVAILPVKADNNPFHDDVVWIATPDHADWLYRTGEPAKAEVRVFLHGMPQEGLTIEYSLGADRMPSDAKGRATIQGGRAVIALGTMHEPGFRDCRMTAHIDGRSYTHHVKVGFSPEKIQPYTQLPADFDSFWTAAKAEAAAYPLTYTRTRSEKYSTDQIDCYLIRLQLNRQGQCIYGYLSIPKGATKGGHPVVMCPPGAGIKTIKNPTRHNYYVEQGGFIRLEIEIHGLNPELDEATFSDISMAFNHLENSYLTNGLDNPQSYYMRRVYLGCLRAVDLLCSLPEWDGRHVVVQGGSQGGGLALVTAGLDPRVTACIANHPALTDMAGYKGGHAGGYPHFFTRMKGMDTPEKVRTMAYYDAVSFARRITCPCILTWGYNDDVCPPTTSYALYNTLRCPKEALLTPVNEHWTSDQTEYRLYQWAAAQCGVGKE